MEENEELPPIVQVTRDEAKVLKHLVKLAGHSEELFQLLGWICRQLLELEKIHAISRGQLQLRAFDGYCFSADRRYRSLGLRRFLTARASAIKDADLAAAGARTEIQELLAVFEEANQRQLAQAVLSRLTLLQQVAGSHQDGTKIALELLKVFTPDQYRRIIELASGQEAD